MRVSTKKVCGIGVNEWVYPSYDGVKRFKQYHSWCCMLERCSSKYWSKFPTYNGVACSDNFKSYSYFYEWCNKQVGFGSIDEEGKSWCLDKDILVKGNKLYSEDVCIFVPHRVNLLLIKRNASRGDLPVGVSWDKVTSKYKATCNNGSGTAKTIGRYSSVQEAFQAYKSYKESVIRQVAEKYKDQLDPRAYEALLNYQVEVTD